MVVDGLDNFPTRYLLNDASVRLADPGRVGGDPRVRGPAVGVQALRRALLSVPVPARRRPPSWRRRAAPTACWACCPGTMGLLQATEVIKLILGEGDPLIGRLLLYDALGATFTEVKIRRDPECPICSREPDAISDEEMGVFPDYEAFCAGRPLGFAARWRRFGSRPFCARGRRREGADRRRILGRRVLQIGRRAPSRDPVAAVLRRWRAQPLRQRLPQRRGRARARGLDTAVGEGDTLVILPAMAGGAGRAGSQT